MVGTDFISDDKSRNVSFRTRKTSLIKKASELSILCDIDVCLIIYGPNTGDRPDTFPENPDDVKRIVARYRASKRKLALSDVLKRKRVVEDKEDSNMRASKKSEYHACINELSEDRLTDLIGKLNSRIDRVESMIACKEKEEEVLLVSSDKEIARYDDSTPLATWWPGCSCRPETVIIDANGCVHVPIMCLVPISSQLNRTRANDINGAGTSYI